MINLPECLKNKTIAVVGGGTPSKNYGDDIDKHDIVIRLNMQFIDNYRGLVGSRTDIQVLGSINELWIIKKKSPCHILFFTHWRDSHISSDLNSEMQIELGTREPTTGFSFLYYLKHNNIKSDVYGCDFYKTRCFYEKEFLERLKQVRFGIYNSKYFIDGEHQVKSVNHNIKLEEDYWTSSPYHNFNY